MSEWVIAPCKGCGVEIESEGPVPDDGWWCSSCWPREENKRLKAQLAERDAELERMRAVIDGLLYQAVTSCPPRDSPMQGAIDDARAALATKP